MTRLIGVLALAVLLLAACGEQSLERGLGGAALGTAAGLGTAALTDADLLSAGLLGAAAGGAVGALTEPETVDLGEPLWQ